MASGKRGAAIAGTPSVHVKVIIQPSSGTDGQLMYEAVNQAVNKSGLLNQLAMRGWLNLLHSTPAVERSLQLRMIGLPDDLIARIEQDVPNPQFVEITQAAKAKGEVSATSRGITEPVPVRRKAEPAKAVATAPETTPTPQAAPDAQVVPAPEQVPRKRFEPPEHSRLGDPFFSGGLA